MQNNYPVKKNYVERGYYAQSDVYVMTEHYLKIEDYVEKAQNQHEENEDDVQHGKDYDRRRRMRRKSRY